MDATRPASHHLVSPIERYREIVPDWDAFRASVGSEEPVTLRVRGALTDEDALARRLERQGFRLDRAGVPGYLSVRDGPGSIAQTVEHWLGQFHIQQSVMGLPSLALAPRPGDRVLDLCAAPGGKTTHLSELMDERGPLVAVDPKEKRLRGLLANVYRLGHANVIVIASDGRDVPRDAGFDRVLVDAPCSGEGNIRRQGGRLGTRSAGFNRHIGSLQRALLRRGIAAARPGGVIVYATCTFAPEENEAVVSDALADGLVDVESIELDAPHAPGIAQWNGRDFDPRVREAWRVYPHHLDSGGLFMIRLRRRASGPDAPPPGWAPIPPVFPGGDLAAAAERIDGAVHELVSRFGYSRSFLTSLGWIERRDHLWAHTASEWPLPAFEAGAEGRWRVVSVGLRALKGARGGRETPSSAFLTRWPDEVPSRRRFEIDAPRLLQLLAGDPVTVDTPVVGPVALVWEGRLLGRAMIDQHGLLRHELGKAKATRLLRLLTVPHAEPSDEE